VSFTNNQSQFPTASSSSRSPASPKMASRSVLDDHGLSSVELDPEGMHVRSDHRADQLVSGRATFSPREGYPTLHASVKMGERVSVTFW
jgi:hypothetical protein